MIVKRAIDLIFLLGFFGTLPVFIVLQTHFNYYWDYVKSSFTDESLEVYDFIVGEL
jgi:hypothetical protein